MGNALDWSGDAAVVRPKGLRQLHDWLDSVGPLVPQGSLPLRAVLIEGFEGGAQGSLPLWPALSCLDWARRAEEGVVGPGDEPQTRPRLGQRPQSRIGWAEPHLDQGSSARAAVPVPESGHWNPGSGQEWPSLGHGYPGSLAMEHTGNLGSLASGMAEPCGTQWFTAIEPQSGTEHCA